MNTDVMFSSNSIEWETPLWLFEELNTIHHFTIDVCATPENKKCALFYSIEDNGLSKSWEGNCWMNPPYGREISKWVQKAYIESRKGTCKVVALLPSRTDTAWFHNYIYRKSGVSIEFLKGRLKFGNAKNSAPFPSMIVTFNSI